MTTLLYRFEAFVGYEREPQVKDLPPTLGALYKAGALDAHWWGYNPYEAVAFMPISPIIVGTFAVMDEDHAHNITKVIRHALEGLGTIVSFEVKWYPEELAMCQWCFYQEDLDG